LPTAFGLGGHVVPEDAIRRRYAAGLRSFFPLYRPLANGWRIYDNSRSSAPRLIASGRAAKVTRVLDEVVWAGIKSELSVKQTKNKVSRGKDIERIFAEGTLHR